MGERNALHDQLTIGDVARRAGVAVSALRFYESEGLISASRAASGHRRFDRDVLRRVAFVRAAQQVGLTLGEIRSSLAVLPEGRTPTTEDWERLAVAWRPRVDEQIAQLERMRDRLTGCIGCGCLSLQRCKLLNPHDEAGQRGSGARYVLEGDDES